MAYTLGISKLLQLRQQHSDQMALDWLSVAMLLRYEPGIVATEQLMQAWGVGQSTVSRRLAALAAAGLLDVSRGHGGYAVHGFSAASIKNEPRLDTVRPSALAFSLRAAATEAGSTN